MNRYLIEWTETDMSYPNEAPRDKKTTVWADSEDDALDKFYDCFDRYVDSNRGLVTYREMFLRNGGYYRPLGIKFGKPTVTEYDDSREPRQFSLRIVKEDAAKAPDWKWIYDKGRLPVGMDEIADALEDSVRGTDYRWVADADTATFILNRETRGGRRRKTGMSLGRRLSRLLDVDLGNGRNADSGEFKDLPRGSEEESIEVGSIGTKARIAVARLLRDNGLDGGMYDVDVFGWDWFERPKFLRVPGPGRGTDACVGDYEFMTLVLCQDMNRAPDFSGDRYADVVP